jgi:hypothetical protein
MWVLASDPPQSTTCLPVTPVSAAATLAAACICKSDSGRVTGVSPWHLQPVVK